MKHPIYTTLSILTCGYLALANARGWNLIQSSANRSAFHSTSYRYRPAVSSGGWSFGGGFHK